MLAVTTSQRTRHSNSRWPMSTTKMAAVITVTGFHHVSPIQTVRDKEYHGQTPRRSFEGISKTRKAVSQTIRLRRLRLTFLRAQTRVFN